MDVGQASLFALEAYKGAPTNEDARSAILQVGESHQLGMPYATGEKHMNRVAWSPDGRVFAAAGADGVVSLWDTASRREVARIEPPQPLAALRLIHHLGVIGVSAGAVAFSPDGSTLAYAENIGYFNAVGAATELATIHLWNVRSRTTTRLLSGHGDRINALAFSPSGSQLASASSDTTVRLWKLSGSGPAVRVLKGHTGPVNSVAFSHVASSLRRRAATRGTGITTLIPTTTRSSCLTPAAEGWSVASRSELPFVRSRSALGVKCSPPAAMTTRSRSGTSSRASRSGLRW